MDVMNSRRNEHEVRCHCGSLMARVTPRGVELKCRRCKRVVLVLPPGAGRKWVAIPAHEEDATAG